jgi:type II secretory pathway component GspD/PulD (secretin)
MFGRKRLLVVGGLAVAALLLAHSASGQEFQEVKTPDGRTIKVPANVPASVLERIRSGAMSGGPGRRPSGRDEEGAAKEEKGEEGDEEKKGEEGEQGEKEGKDEEKKDGEKSDEKPEPIKRESTPPHEPDPRELEVRPDERGLVQFNFVGQKWLDVLQWLAENSNMSLDWQELPGDYLNLTTQRPYTIPETRNLINQHLLARGYTLLSHGEVLSVVKIDNLDPSLVPRVEPEELVERQPYEYVKVSFPLDWLLAEDAVEELKPMLSPNGKLTALKATNRLEAMDAVANLGDIYRVLKEEQSGTGQERLVREFELKHSRAEHVVEQLHDLLGIEKKSSGPAKPMTPDQMRAMQEAAKRAAEAAKKGGAPAKSKPQVYLVANKRKNSILANAPPDVMAKIEQAIEAFDVPSDHAHSLLRNMDRMHVYRLESVEPEALIRTLDELGDLDFDTQLEADEENNAIIAYASLADHLTIGALVQKLDRGGRRAEVIQLTELRAESVAEIIDFMMGGGKEEEEGRSRGGRSYYPWDRYRYSSRRDDEHDDRFRVDADAGNNTLVLWCNEFELRKVEDLLERLRDNQGGESGVKTVKVHRLVTLDPEPFVQTLQEMETLGFQARLEVDAENNSIIAFASEADHRKIEELIEELDGSGRQFHVISLRQLEADYVAGTIAFMMAGKGDTEQSSGYSRTYIDYNFFGSGPSLGRGQSKKPDEFRVDADVEYNRLLLWANEVEMEEVNNLLVKLGEIPPEGGDTSTIRVLDVLPGPEKERLLERIRRVWPSLAPNPLVTPKAEESAESQGPEGSEQPEGGTEAPQGSEEEPSPSNARPTTAASAAVLPSLPSCRYLQTGPLRIARSDVREDHERSVFRFAQLEQGGVEPAASQGSVSQEPPSEEPGSDKSGSEKSGSDKSGSEKSGSAKSASDEPASQQAASQQAASQESGQPEQTQTSGQETSPQREDPSQPPTAESQVPQESGEEAAQQGAEAEKSPAPPGDSPGKSAEAPPKSAPPPAAAAPDDAGSEPPVSITEAPDGRLIITSQDTEALSRLEELISRLAPQRKDYHVFKLEWAEAYWVKWNLEDFFEEEDEGDSSRRSYFDPWYYPYRSSSGSRDTSRRLSRRRPLRFISDDDTNTILVQGATPDQLRTIQDLIDLYDQPPSTDSQSVRKTQVFQIHYSEADVVAEAVKDVYRDLLSERDKSLAGRPDQQRTESRYSYTYVYGGEEGERKMPRWKGYLSIGVDTLSNSLIVSAPEFLFRDIEKLIQDLDEAAKPTDAVQVMQLGQGVSASVVHETLSKVLAEAAGAKPAGRPNGESRRREAGSERRERRARD